MIKLKIKKIGVNKDSPHLVVNNDFISQTEKHPNNINIGYVINDALVSSIDDLKSKLVVDRSFCVHRSAGIFATSKITKVINDRMFMTKNSIYEIEIIENLENVEDAKNN